MSLYRKYRPQTFSHLVGQNHINQTLMNALKLDRVNHAYLFTGPRGTGKTSTARLMSKAINCLNVVDSEPCNACEICVDITDGKLIDLIEIDAASNRGIDEIRDLREKINFAPTRAKSKVYIIDEVHMLTKEAFNALLKTLEEPPSHVYFILATTEAHKIPETILSRCQRFDFKRIDDGVLVDRLKFIAGEESIVADEKALELISHHSEGGMRDAIGLLEQLSTDNKLSYEHVCNVLGVSGIASIEKLFDLLKTGNTADCLKEIAELYAEGFDLLFFNKRFLEYLRKKMLKAVNENNSLETVRILKLIANFQAAYDQVRYATIPQLPLEMAIVKSSLQSSPGELPTERQHQKIEMQTHPPIEKKVEILSEQQTDPAEKKSPDLNLSSNSEVKIEEISENIIGDIKLDDVKKVWKNIESNIETPVARRCFQQGTPLKVEGNKLVLAFSNQFNLNKLMETANRTEAENAITKAVGGHVKIIGEIHQIPREVRKVQEVRTEDKELQAKVLDIFAGEMV